MSGSNAATRTPSPTASRGASRRLWRYVALTLLLALLLLPAPFATAAPAAKPSPSSKPSPSGKPSPARSGRPSPARSGKPSPARSGRPHATRSPRALTSRSHAATSAPPPSCHFTPPHARLQTTWQQTRLGFQRVWPITKGGGVRVAVIDSGLDTDNPQLSGIRLAPGIDVAGTGSTQDCVKHGTEVTAIIAAQQISASAFVGVAPEATIIPIKQTNNDGSGTSATLARAIDAAVSARARVANVSLTVAHDYPDVRAAVARARRAGLIIVAATGNDGGHGNGPTWPAAYSTEFDNVIAVSASDRSDTVPQFPEHGRYVDVAAPGAGYQVPAPGGAFDSVTGTSFAAPYVTGTVALMLAADPRLTPGEVRRRLELTADSPPAVAVPDPRYGYGIIDSYLAVTAVLAPRETSSASVAAAPIAPPVAPTPPDRHAQHVALAAFAALFALAALVVAGAAVIRRGMQERSGQRAG